MKNKYFICGDVAFIEIKHERLSLHAIIDKNDLDTVNSMPNTWYGHKQCNTIYVRGCVRVDGVKKTVYLHQMLLPGSSTELYVDHKNHNGLDNRSANIHLVTASQNQHNKGPQFNNTSGERGVYWDKCNQKWISRVVINNKVIFKKGFILKADAINAVKEARKKYMANCPENITMC